MRCRDSSLYGRVQTILQDLILDLLKCGDLRDFRVFARFAFSHISRISRFCALRVFNISHISHFAYIVSFAHFTFSHFSRFDMRYCAPPWDPSHSVRMSCPHPPRSIGAYLILFHSHSIIYVFAFPFMFIYLIMCLYYITLVRLALLTWLRGLGTRLAC